MASKKKKKNASKKDSSEINKTQENSSKEVKTEETNETIKKEQTKKTEVKSNENKAEKVVFKNNENDKEKKDSINKNLKKETNTKAEMAKNEILEKKENSKRKIGASIIILIAVLVVVLVFSTIFALIQSTKNTIAKGVRINGIDISGLTYDEAKEKLNEAFKTVMDVEIELNYKEYNYKIKSDDIELYYNFKKELDEAYSIGRKGNILECNYKLIDTAFIGKDFNVDYQYKDEAIDSIVDEISTNVPGLVTQYSYYIDEDELIINPGVDGIQVEREKLKENIISNIKNRNPLEIIKNFKNEKIEIPCSEVTAAPIDIDKIYSEVHTDPENAYFIEATETEKAKIFADVDGIDFAISIDEAKEKLKEDSTEYVIPLSRQKAEITINDIGLEAFPNKLQEFSTRYDASNWGRSENLKIATSKIDGTVLMPGQQFSFNGVVGERTVQAGYKNAAIFEGDQVVDGLAGGICQVSSTLYNVALLANLQIDERYNHSFKTSYLEFGRDATVVYGIKDFKFTNTRSYPIKIEGSAENGVMSFAIYGIEEDEEYKINIIPVVTSSIPYTTQTTVNYSLAPGAVRVIQGGSSGARVTTYKEMILNGAVVSKEAITNDTYKAMSRVVETGPEATPVYNPEPSPVPAVEEPVASPESEPISESIPEPASEPTPESVSETTVETPAETSE